MNLEIGKRYEVLWLDAHFHWEPDPHEELCSACRTTGWLTRESEAGIQLAYEVGERGIADGTRFHIDIPKSMILEIDEI